MSVEIIMPKAGVAMEEGTIVSWLKNEGDVVSIGDPIIEITTDKVNMEIEAEGNGILAVQIHGDGEVLPVFTVIGLIAEEGEDVEALRNLAKEDKQPEKEKVEETKIEEARTSTSSNDNNNEYDIVVVGGGPGGYIAAIKAAMLGGKVAIVEEDIMGGTCLNRGCIPTKTYIKNVEVLEDIKQMSKRGIKIQVDASQDINKAVEYKNEVVKKLTSGVDYLLKSHGVEIFNCKAEVKKAKEVILSNGKILNTKNIIIATGSKVRMLPIEGIDSKLIMTSTEALDFNEVPAEMVIIGGGVIGCEFAEIFNSRGSKVTIIEKADKLIPMLDKEITKSLKESFVKKGITVLVDKDIVRFKEEGNKLVVELRDETLNFDRGLYSIGRQANLNGLENLDIELDRGAISVNDKMETSIPSIYAVGDVNGKLMLAHSAFKMGEVAAKNAMGEDEKVNLNSVPSCVYTVPEIASVGMTEEEARAKYDVKIGKFNFSGNGKSLAAGHSEGYIKVVADARYNEILGVHMFGHGVTEIINQAAAFKSLEIPTDEAADIIFGHPCSSEALMEALADVNGECLHLPKK